MQKMQNTFAIEGHSITPQNASHVYFLRKHKMPTIVEKLEKKKKTNAKQTAILIELKTRQNDWKHWEAWERIAGERAHAGNDLKPQMKTTNTKMWRNIYIFV